MSDRKDYFVQTYTGKKFYPFNPQADQIDIVDIAHSLSRICRFGGHIEQFYSVAQHSVLVSDMVPLEYATEALLHDASEAYIGDIVSPVKRGFPDLQTVEESIQRVIAYKFNLDYPFSEYTKEADLLALATEGRDLRISNSWNSDNMPTPMVAKIKPCDMETAKSMFILKAKFFGLL